MSIEKNVGRHDVYRSNAGTDVMILKIFSPKKLAKNWRFLLKLLLVFFKKVITTLVFDKKRQFILRNMAKTLKIVSPGKPKLADKTPLDV
jgi:hypothetical protein